MHFLKLAGKKVEKVEKAVSFSGSHVLQGLAEAVPPFPPFPPFLGQFLKNVVAFGQSTPFPPFPAFWGQFLKNVAT